MRILAAGRAVVCVSSLAEVSRERPTGIISRSKKNHKRETTLFVYSKHSIYGPEAIPTLSKTAKHTANLKPSTSLTST